MVNTQEYATKLEQFINGQITVQDWMAYCKSLLFELLEQPANKAVMVRLKDR